MGGAGSGRRDGKRCLDNVRRLDVRPLQREAQLTVGSRFALTWTRDGEAVRSVRIQVHTACVILSHWRQLQAGKWEEITYPVGYSWTSCTYGGRRLWWHCPAAGCGRRVAILYDGSMFACRHCHRLAYRSQRETEDDRAVRRADKLRDKLGWIRGIANGDGGKPHGMRWRTYRRLQAAYYVQSMRAFAGISSRLGLVSSRLENLKRDG